MRTTTAVIFCSQVVTFQQWNPKVSRRYCNKRKFPHINRNRWELTRERVPANIPQVASNVNFANQIDSYPSSIHVQQPRSLRSKIKLIFSRFNRDSNRCSNTDIEKTAHCEAQNTELYHFDHGDPSHYSVTDSPPCLTSDIIAQQVHETFSKFWAEFFGYINLAVTFVITFVIQFIRWVWWIYSAWH